MSEHAGEIGSLFVLVVAGFIFVDMWRTFRRVIDADKLISSAKNRLRAGENESVVMSEMVAKGQALGVEVELKELCAAEELPCLADVWED